MVCSLLEGLGHASSGKVWHFDALRLLLVHSQYVDDVRVNSRRDKSLSRGAFAPLPPSP